MGSFVVVVDAIRKRVAWGWDLRVEVVEGLERNRKEERSIEVEGELGRRSRSKKEADLSLRRAMKTAQYVRESC